MSELDEGAHVFILENGMKATSIRGIQQLASPLTSMNATTGLRI